MALLSRAQHKYEYTGQACLVPYVLCWYYRFSHCTNFLCEILAALALLFFLLRFLTPRGTYFLLNFSYANPREAAFILAAIDFQQFVLRVTLQVLPHRADLFAGAHHDFFLNALAQRKVDQVVHSRLDVWKEIFVLQHILQGLSGSVCREH